jgi:hypothetical protein
MTDNSNKDYLISVLRFLLSSKKLSKNNTSLPHLINAHINEIQQNQHHQLQVFFSRHS